MTAPDTLTTEVAVIGSGPGGATTAHLLAEHSRDVVVLEEGRDLPLESCAPFSLQEMAQKYRAGGLNPTIGKSKIAFVEGCVLGGGSEINSGLYHRTPQEMLERWKSEFRLREASPADLLPHFEYIEHALSVGTSPVPAPPASARLEYGARQLGWRSMEVPRWYRFEDPQATSARGTRQSMSKTFLPRAVAAGARLLPMTRAHRVRRSASRWEVQANHAGREIAIRAEAVFVCGGAVQTPLLLRRSGIHRNAGNTLAMHPTVKVIAVFDDPVNDENAGVPMHQVKEFSPRLSFGCSISSPPYLAMALSDARDYRGDLRRDWRHMAVYYVMITGPSTGIVRQVFDWPDPLIRYKLADADWRDLASGLRLLCRLLFAAGARQIYPCMAGAKQLCTEDDLSTIPASLVPERANLMTIHLFSSCPTGEARGRCAVDSFGQVHDAPGLYVNDASLIPTAIGVNPQGTVMALARRNTLRYLGRI